MPRYQQTMSQITEDIRKLSTNCVAADEESDYSDTCDCGDLDTRRNYILNTSLKHFENEVPTYLCKGSFFDAFYTNLDNFFLRRSKHEQEPFFEMLFVSTKFC